MYACMMRKLCLLILSAAAALSFSSCADTAPPKSAENNTGVSQIPWDQPEKWETGSQIPGAEMMNSQ